MSYKVQTIDSFEKEVRKLFKKYPSIKDDIFKLIQLLKEEPKQGNAIGKDCYKIRLAIKSKGRGKSGGARVITFVKIVNSIVYLLAIYDKSEKENITEKELRDFIKRMDD